MLSFNFCTWLYLPRTNPSSAIPHHHSDSIHLSFPSSWKQCFNFYIILWITKERLYCFHSHRNTTTDISQQWPTITFIQRGVPSLLTAAWSITGLPRLERKVVTGSLLKAQIKLCAFPKGSLNLLKGPWIYCHLNEWWKIMEVSKTWNTLILQACFTSLHLPWSILSYSAADQQ